MNYLKELRTEKGVSQQIVADYLGISRQAYGNYENGNREPDFESLLKLGEFFNRPIDYILRGPNSEEANTSPFSQPQQQDLSEEMLILNRAAKKMTTEQRKQLLDMARIMFKEEFDD